jgi:ABC-type multidrug transport system ATPase subunit
MKISLENAGKRYNREWIFRGATIDFISGNAYAITGPNGSGKSTLLQAIAGILQLSEGRITYSDTSIIADEKIFSEVSFCAPYMEVMEEMTLLEFLSFHGQFKSYLPGLDIHSIVDAIGLRAAAHKQIRFYSSGMKQRVKLAQAIFSNTKLLLLDEPTSNLDKEGIELYYHLVDQYSKDRVVIICSNDAEEYRFCNEIIAITTFKKALQQSF